MVNLFTQFVESLCFRHAFRTIFLHLKWCIIDVYTQLLRFVILNLCNSFLITIQCLPDNSWTLSVNFQYNLLLFNSKKLIFIKFSDLRISLQLLQKLHPFYKGSDFLKRKNKVNFHFLWVIVVFTRLLTAVMFVEVYNNMNLFR
jgi:hypothetical protein